MINHRFANLAMRLLFSLFIISLFLLYVWIASARADERVVTVGIYQNAPKVFTAESGAPAGIFVDIIEHIAKTEGWRLRYVPGTWSEGLDRLVKAEIDLMPDMAYTSDRAKIFAFQKVPVLSSWFQVYAKESSDIKSILDLGGKRIAVLDRSVQQEAFSRLATGFGLTTTIISLPDYQDIFEAVAKGEADAAITNRFYGPMHAKKLGLEDTAVIFSPSDLFFAAPKGRDEKVLNAIDANLTSMKADPQSIYYQSLKRWTSEEARFKLPLWLQVLGLVLGVVLLLSLAGSLVLKHQVNTRTQELQVVNRALRMLSECNQALVRSSEEAGLIDAVCRIVVTSGGYRLAWVDLVQAGAPETIHPVSQAGIGDKKLTSLKTVQDHAESIGNLINKALGTGRFCLARHILTDPSFRALRTEALKFGYASALVLPLLTEKEKIGVMVICSGDPTAFDQEEVAQLTELTNDMAFGIASHRTHAANKLAEAQRQEAQQRFVDIVEFCPTRRLLLIKTKK